MTAPYRRGCHTHTHTETKKEKENERKKKGDAGKITRKQQEAQIDATSLFFLSTRLSIVIFATQKDEGIRTKPAKPTHSTWHTAGRGRKGDKEKEREREG